MTQDYRYYMMGASNRYFLRLVKYNSYYNTQWYKDVKIAPTEFMTSAYTTRIHPAYLPNLSPVRDKMKRFDIIAHNMIEMVIRKLCDLTDNVREAFDYSIDYDTNGVLIYTEDDCETPVFIDGEIIVRDQIPDGLLIYGIEDINKQHHHMVVLP